MIYIDILVIEDIILNYITLLGTGILLNRITNIKRILISSIIGIVPVAFLLTSTGKLMLNIINFLILIVISIISFDYKNIIYTFKNILYIYFISIFLAGSIYLINTNYLPKINSDILKITIYILISVISTYIYIKNLKKLTQNNSTYYKIDIYLKDEPKVTLMSFLDTGNKLMDPYSKKPIILVSKNKINISNKKTILVPYNTIDNHGLIKCFSPEKIYIDKVGYKKRLLIGLIDKVNIENADCIMNEKLLERI